MLFYFVDVKLQSLVSAWKVQFDWQMGTSAKKGGWRCVLVEYGGVFVEMAGTRWMLTFFVNNWT